MAEEHFDADHIHTTPEGRHFRHGDGVEMDGEGNPLTQATLKVKLLHRSLIPHARWCDPVGWEPTNEIEGAEFFDGSWWSEYEEEAGLVCWVQGDEGNVIEVTADDLRVVSTGDCRVIAKVEV